MLVMEYNKMEWITDAREWKGLQIVLPGGRSQAKKEYLLDDSIYKKTLANQYAMTESRPVFA